jgi:predicted nucleic acid-binding protein
MISFDTNIAVHAANRASPAHRPAVEFLQSIASRRDVAVCELMLVELYLKLRNEKIFPHPLTASQAVAVCDAYRKNQAWSLIDCAPVMDAVWAQAGQRQFAFRRIIDVRLGMTLLRLDGRVDVRERRGPVLQADVRQGAAMQAGAMPLVALVLLGREGP